MRKVALILSVAGSVLLILTLSGCGGGTTSPPDNPPPPVGLTQNHFAFLRLTGNLTAPQPAVQRQRARQARLLSKAGLSVVPNAVAAGPIDVFTMLNTGAQGSEVQLSTTSSFYFSAQLSANGKKAVYTAGVDTGAGAGYVQLFVVDTATKAVTQLTSDLEDHWDAQLSADGSKVLYDAFDESTGNFQIHTMSSSGGAETQLVPGEDSLNLSGYDVYFPTFAPNGRIVFRNNWGGELFIINGDGTGLTQLTSGDDYTPSVSPDGTKIVFERDWVSETEYGWDVWIMDIDGQNAQVLAPNGWDPLYVNNKIVFMGDLDNEGDMDIYAINPDGTGQVELVDTTAEETFYWYPG